MNESLFLKGSMLLEIKDFKEADKKLKSMYIFKSEGSSNSFEEKQSLIKKIGMKVVIYMMTMIFMI